MLILDRSKTDTPFALDLLRATAAQVVCAGHALSFSGFRPHRLPLMQNVGVLLFFVLSGFLISRSLIDRSRSPDYSFRRFFIDRFARIYSGLIPALAVVAFVDFLVIKLTGNAAPYFTWPNFAVNALLFNDYRGALSNYDTLQWSAFGTASPMWTLTIEWHIYLFVGAIFFIGRRPKAALYLIPIAIIFGQVPSHYIFGAFQPDGVGQGLFLLWIGGAIFAIIADDLVISRTISIGLLMATTFFYLYYVKAGHEYDPWTYPLVVAFLVLTVSATQQTKLVKSERLTAIVKFAADYSFTLYLTHYSILSAFNAVWAGSSWSHVVAPILISNLIAAVVAVPTEMKHRQFAGYIRRMVLLDPKRADRAVLSISR